MNMLGLSVITILGLVLVVTGAIGVGYYIVRYRRTRKRFENGQSDKPDMPSNTFGSIWILNGFLHIGMLMLILGGAGLIYYGQR